MHVLVTRPKGDGETLKARIEQLGCRASLEPLISIVPNAIPVAAIENATGLIATSRNALRALAGTPALGLATTLPLFAVGPGTAAIARDLGFKNIFEGAGTGADLVPILAPRSGDDGVLVHLAGDVLAFDLAAALARENVNIRSVEAYRSVVAKSLSPQIAEALRNQDVDVVILMSPRTAETWTRLMVDLSPPADLSGVTYICLSKAVADVLRSHFDDPKIVIAAHLNLEEMLVLLKRLAARPEAE
jgi:uroporphyrinogen-III synthase